MTFHEPQQPMIINGKVKHKAPIHRLIQLSDTNTLALPINTPRKNKISREELKELLVSSDVDINKNTIKDLYFEFHNTYNLIFTVYYTMARGTSVHKDFDNPTKAFHFWMKTHIRRNSAPFISIKPPKSDSFPFNFRADGYRFQIALRYIEYIERTEEWVKFLEESHPEDLR